MHFRPVQDNWSKDILSNELYVEWTVCLLIKSSKRQLVENIYQSFQVRHFVENVYWFLIVIDQILYHILTDSYMSKYPLKLWPLGEWLSTNVFHLFDAARRRHRVGIRVTFLSWRLTFFSWGHTISDWLTVKWIRPLKVKQDNPLRKTNKKHDVWLTSNGSIQQKLLYNFFLSVISNIVTV